VDGISTSFPPEAEEVAKASQGHDPRPFLISDVKELMQRYICKFQFSKKIFLSKKKFTRRCREQVKHKGHKKSFLHYVLRATRLMKFKCLTEDAEMRRTG
jgi:hypothetical protein